MFAARRHGKGVRGRNDVQSAEELRVSLDRCWDLLRQRRALRETGGDPDRAQARPADVVERYQQ